MKKKIIIVGGARPNFVKIAALFEAFKKQKQHFEVALVHTGQHHDYLMSKIFFDHLRIPRPDIYLNVGSASHAAQTAKIMMAFENALFRLRPDLVIVVGDVNSTLACSLVAAKLNIKVAHVEAGLRSFDRTMPEEINRIVTDSLSDYLFVTEDSGVKNLRKEGVGPKKIFFVGNTMIDTLLANMVKVDKSGIIQRFKLGTKNSKTIPYAVLTLHRPSNVDSKDSFLQIRGILESITPQVKIIYPIHPRSKRMMRLFGLSDKFAKIKNLLIINPLGYVDFIKLLKGAKFVLTDSGGIQEEATVLNVPCLTMRENTERPVTITSGTNYLVGRDKKKIGFLVAEILKGKVKKRKIYKFWDGKAADRIARVLSGNYNKN